MTRSANAGLKVLSEMFKCEVAAGFWVYVFVFVFWNKAENGA